MKEIVRVLKGLKGQTIEPNIVRQAIESVDLSKITLTDEVVFIEKDAHGRQTIIADPVQLFLMTWPPQFFYPIHQHNNFWGFVVPIQGVLSETIYGYAPNKKKVFIHPTKTFGRGNLIYQPLNVIHKLQNASPLDPLITLHIYYPPGYNFKGTTIFDAKNRTLAILNEKANTLSWDLPEDNYDQVVEDAYSLEKLF